VNARSLLAALAVSLGWPAQMAWAQAADSASTPAAAEPVQEVTVHGERPEPGREEMTGEEVKQLPGAFGDAFRAIEAMPGVTPLVSGVPYFLVRGAPPGNTGFFIDGIPVPALFHLGVGTAVVHPSLIDRVDFYPGGYPAYFGRYTGGILSGELARQPDRAHEEASIRLVDAGGLVSTPFADGKGDVLVSGRYGYPGPLVSLFDPNVSLSYWDYQTRVRWRPGDHDEISVLAFGSYDSLYSRDNATEPMEELLGIQFHRVDLRWDRQTSPTGSLRVALTLGYDRSATGSGGLGSTEEWIEDESVRLRAEWSEHLARGIDVRAGSDVAATPYRIVLPGAGPNLLGGTQNTAAFTQVDVNGGVYGELVWVPASRVEIRPGLRADVFTSRSSTGAAPLGIESGYDRAAGAIDPRLSARWTMTDWLSWIAALGVAHQASNIPLPSPGLQFSQLSRGVQAAYQYSAGAEMKLPLKFTATVDGFLQDYTGLADLYESCPPGESTCNFDGRAVGLEVLVRRKLTERLTGWLSYTLSNTERDAFNQGHWVRVLSQYDRPHVANLVLAADLGKRWRAGVRLLAYSGLPYSTTTGTVGIPNAREPPFFRLDLRLEKKWPALGGTLTLVFEWLNALLSKESFGTDCSFSGAPGPGGGIPQTQCVPQQIGPVTVPSIGVEESW
jgi:hypothetical protein